MIRFDRRARAFALLLAGVAGYVDAVGFVQLGGYFVSFMSGNSTRMSVGLAQGSQQGLIAGALIALFVAGVCVGSLVGHAFERRRPPIVLALVAGALTLATLSYAMAVPAAGAALLVMAMGALNTVFEHDGDIRVGLTYMTGALVKVGQRLAAALRGGNRWDFVPHFLLWFSLVLGAVTGAALHSRIGAAALWVPAAAAYVLALAAARLRIGADGRIDATA